MKDPISELEKLIKKSSASEVARQIGIPRQYLSQILHGQRPPSNTVLEFLGLQAEIRYTTRGNILGP